MKNHNAIRQRASEAIRDLYHNATPRYPNCESDEEWQEFLAWFQDTAYFELEYVQDGGCYGGKKRLSWNERAEQAKYAPWERISQYGKLYSWGRGGRTIAPNDLVKQCGGSSFVLRESLPDEMSIEDCVELIRVVESFNQYVKNWNKSVPELWEEEKQNRLYNAESSFPNENNHDFERVNV